MRPTYLGKGAENLWGHLQVSPPVPIIHKLWPQRSVGLGNDGLLKTMAVAVQLRSGEAQGLSLMTCLRTSERQFWCWDFSFLRSLYKIQGNHLLSDYLIRGLAPKYVQEINFPQSPQKDQLEWKPFLINPLGEVPLFHVTRVTLGCVTFRHYEGHLYVSSCASIVSISTSPSMSLSVLLSMHNEKWANPGQSSTFKLLKLMQFKVICTVYFFFKVWLLLIVINGNM